MIKWNKVTWYSRLCALVLFLGIIPALSFYFGQQYELAVFTEPIPVPTFSLVSMHQKVASTTPAGISTKGYSSPNGVYTAITHTDGQEASTTIFDGMGKALGQASCGSFDSWSPDSTRIKIYVPSDCGYPADIRYYYLTITGVEESLDGLPLAHPHSSVY